MTKVGVFVHWRSPFGQSQLARRQKKFVEQISDRQWRDLLGVLKVQAGTLDRAYLDQWAGELGVADLLPRALEEAGLSESGS